MWLPDWLYERLPLLYLLAGVGCWWLLGGSVAAKMSGVLLITAAGSTYHLRRKARQGAALRAHSRGRRGVTQSRARHAD